MRRIVSRFSPLVLAAVLSTAVAAEPDIRAELSAPRDFGYVMGDLIEHSIEVSVPKGYVLETEFLPKPGAFDEWLDVRAVDWREDRNGDTGRYRIRVTYHLFKGVRNSEKAGIPPLPIRFRGPQPLEVKAPAWEFTVIPIIPPQLDDERIGLRGPLPAPLAPTQEHRARLFGYGGGMLAAGAVLVWLRHARMRHAAPFARALVDVKALLHGAPGPDRYRDAVRRLHRALDETAGHTVFADQVDAFLARHPAFSGLRDELAHFFALSQCLFFLEPAAAPPPEYPARRLQDFCRRGAEMERRWA